MDGPLILSLRQLQEKPLALIGELGVVTLDLGYDDELIQPLGPLQYDLEVERYGKQLRLQGRLEMSFHCECARCLASFEHVLRIEGWECLVPLEGDEASRAKGDCVDLTPYLREDIVLAMPSRPLCGVDCEGLPRVSRAQSGASDRPADSAAGSTDWGDLDKLKL